MRPGRLRQLALPLLLLQALGAVPAQGHDPSAWGGLFRSRDHGATWVTANRGPYLSGAIALAISPTDAGHLMMGTESGLLRSRNGGRDWTVEAPSVLLGSVFALAFAADGQRALASTSLGIFRSESENNWVVAPAPRGAAPARAIMRGSEAGRAYLVGWTGLYRSDDWGASWSDAANGLPQEPVTALVVTRDAPETLHAVVHGRIWTSVDGARSWAGRGGGSAPAGIGTLAAEPEHPARLWAAAGNGLFRSTDGGANWQRAGQPLPEPNTEVKALAPSRQAILAATEHGLYRSGDGGESWTPGTDDLPAHLEVGPLLRDPSDPATLYAGFALTPYRELWRRAATQEGALAQLSMTGVAGGVLILLLVGLAAVALLRRLRPYYQPSAGSSVSAGMLDNRRTGGETLP